MCEQPHTTGSGQSEATKHVSNSTPSSTTLHTAEANRDHPQTTTALRNTLNSTSKHTPATFKPHNKSLCHLPKPTSTAHATCSALSTLLQGQSAFIAVVQIGKALDAAPCRCIIQCYNAARTEGPPAEGKLPNSHHIHKKHVCRRAHRLELVKAPQPLAPLTANPLPAQPPAQHTTRQRVPCQALARHAQQTSALPLAPYAASHCVPALA